MYHFTKEELLELLNNVYEAGCYGFADLKEAEVEKFISECEKHKPENLPFPPYTEPAKSNIDLSNAFTAGPMPWNTPTPPSNVTLNTEYPPPSNAIFDLTSVTFTAGRDGDGVLVDEETIRMIDNGGQVTIIASDDSKGMSPSPDLGGDFVITMNQDIRRQPSQPYPFSLELPPSPSVVVYDALLGSQRNTIIH